MHLQKVKKCVAEALECSVFVNPREPGLTYDEIKEIGARAGFKEGEIGDAFVTMGLHPMVRGSKLLGPEHTTLVAWKSLCARLRNTATSTRSISSTRSSASSPETLAKLERASIVAPSLRASFRGHR